MVGPILVAILDGGPSYARPVRDGGILSSPRGQFLFFARLAHFKRVECDPFDQGCTPLAPERKDPSFEMMLKLLSFFITLSLFFFLARSFSLSPCSPFSFSPCILRSLSYSSHCGACDQQPGTRRELLLAPGTGASPLTFRTIRELPVLLLRGCVSKTTPGQ